MQLEENVKLMLASLQRQRNAAMDRVVDLETTTGVQNFKIEELNSEIQSLVETTDKMRVLLEIRSSDYDNLLAKFEELKNEHIENESESQCVEQASGQFAHVDNIVNDGINSFVDASIKQQLPDAKLIDKTKRKGSMFK